MAKPRLGPRSAVLFETSFDSSSAGSAERVHDRVSVTLNPRAQRPSLRVDPMRRIAVLTVPDMSEMDRAQRFADENAEWIRVHLRRLPAPLPFREGHGIPVRGIHHTLTRPSTRGRPHFLAGPPAELVVPSHADMYASRVRRFLIETAQRDFLNASRRHADALNVTFRKLSVKDTVSRWGSCSSRGTLSYSWRIVCAPPFVLDYLSAHEVSHLREPNHSKRFWSLVNRLTPHRNKAQAWLQSEGASLFAIGADA